MGLQATLVLGNRIEYAGDTVGNIVLDDIPHIPAGKQDADTGVDDVQVVAFVDIEKYRQRAGNEMDKPLQHHGGQTGQHSDK